MRNLFGPGLIFLLCLCVSLVFNMPLVHLRPHIKLPNSIGLGNIEGTLLGGHIDVLQANGLQASNLNYKNKLSCLLKLKLCYQIDFDQGRGLVSANALDQSLGFSDARISYPVEELTVLFPQLLVKPSGDLQIDIEHLSFKQQKVSINKGFALWSRAGVVGESFDLGSYQLSVSSAKQSYQFELTDNKAELEVDGKGQLKSNGQYLINVNIKSKPGVDQQIKGALDLIGKKRGLNQYTMQHTGQLAKQVLSQLSFEDN